MLSETMSKGGPLVPPMVKQEEEFEKEKSNICEPKTILKTDSKENILSQYIQNEKVSLEKEDTDEVECKELDEDEKNKILDENRIERMELENYSLRKRCKRLENIVSQLLENKGKEEDEDDNLEAIRNQVVTETYKGELSTVSKKQFDKTNAQDEEQTDDNDAFNLGRQSSLNENPPVMKSIFVSVSNFSAESLATSSRLKSPKRSYSSHRPVSHIHIPLTLREEEQQSQNLCSIKSQPVLDDSNFNKKSQLQSSSRKNQSKYDKDDDANISPEEMEQRNEVFRSTYYLSQTTTSRKNSTTKSRIISPTFDERSRHSPPYHFKEEPSPPHYRYKSERKSPPSASTSLYNSYYNRFYKHNPELEHKHVRYQSRHDEENLHHHHITHDFHSDHLTHSTRYSSKIQSTELPLERQLPSNSHHNLHSAKDVKPRVASPIDIHSYHYSHMSTRCGQIRNRPYPANPVRRSMHRLLSAEQDLSKYNSDFYTKLPPKLHIVESQNDTGVTLTWNSTSNCDSSLVKSYQLFARELFGHKIGTMKRIGVVDALPLPMSCNIDKLKYHIKYKFAVCAIDIYGRYGKMSNFTGKFELKPKGAFSELPPPPPPQEIDNSEESQLEIII